MQTVELESVGLSSERLTRVGRASQSYIDRGVIAGAITLAARHGKLAHRECRGKMDIEAGTPMQADTILRVYSMAKPVTALALMTLVEQGRVLLSDPLSKYLPALKTMRVCTGRDASGALVTVPAVREITLCDLLTHTAGISYGIFDDTPVDDLFHAASILSPIFRMLVGLDEMASRIAAVPLANQPGALAL